MAAPHVGRGLETNSRTTHNISDGRRSSFAGAVPFNQLQDFLSSAHSSGMKSGGSVRAVCRLSRRLRHFGDTYGLKQDYSFLGAIVEAEGMDARHRRDRPRCR